MPVKQTISHSSCRLGQQTDFRPDTHLQFHQIIWTSYFHDNLLAFIWPWTDRFVCLPASNQPRARVCVGRACPGIVTDCALGRGCITGSQGVWAAWLWLWPLFKLQSTHVTTTVFVCAWILVWLVTIGEWVFSVCVCVCVCCTFYGHGGPSWPREASACATLDSTKLMANGCNLS